MQKKNPKTRCERQQCAKSKEVVRCYNKIQSAYVKLINDDENIIEFECNVLLENLDIGEYTTDFLCKKKDGAYMVRECVERRKLIWPSVVKLLDASRVYWISRGIEDWGLVIDKEKMDA